MLKKKIWATFQRIIEVFTQIIATKLSKIWDWNQGSEIRKKTYSGSQIQGSKRHRIPDPDPQHCLYLFVDVTDPLAERLNSLADVEEEMPGFLAATRDWFRFESPPSHRSTNFLICKICTDIWKASFSICSSLYGSAHFEIDFSKQFS
jgi:hypothetical protein